MMLVYLYYVDEDEVFFTEARDGSRRYGVVMSQRSQADECGHSHMNSILRWELAVAVDTFKLCSIKVMLWGGVETEKHVAEFSELW